MTVAADLTLEQAARMMRESVRDKSYRAYPLGGEAGHYLRWKRGRLTDSSYVSYESCLDKLARHFLDLELADFEPPIGTERLEEFLDERWGSCAWTTYNGRLSILKDFFFWATLKGKLHGDPARPIPLRKKRAIHREIFNESARLAIIAGQNNLRDRLVVRLLFFTGIRKGALRQIQFKHFDHHRRRLTVFTKGEKVREVPIPAHNPEGEKFWAELEQHILEWGAHPDDYLLPARKTSFAGYDRKTGEPLKRVTEFRQREGDARPTGTPRPMGPSGIHHWWYGCLEQAGIVPKGTRSGEKLHKTRHTSGQLVLDRTRGNLKAVQKHLGHVSIATTGDIYTDWDIDQLSDTLDEVWSEDV